MAQHKQFNWKHLLANATVLVGLMLLTVWAATIEMGIFNFPVAMGIALTKMCFILMVFMNVWNSSALTRLFVGSGFFWLVILLVFIMTDFVPATVQLGTPTVPPLP